MLSADPGTRLPFSDPTAIPVHAGKTKHIRRAPEEGRKSMIGIWVLLALCVVLIPMSVTGWVT